MVKKLLAVIAGLAQVAGSLPVLLELGGVAAVAIWAGQTWGGSAVWLVVGIALLGKSLEADARAGGDG